MTTDAPEQWHEDTALVRMASMLIAGDFADDENEDGLPVVDGYDALRALLSERIAGMLARDPEQLMHVLYRLDVAEASVRSVLTTAWPGDVPFLLAGLVIERELRKAVTRQQHARSSSSEEP